MIKRKLLWMFLAVAVCAMAFLLCCNGSNTKKETIVGIAWRADADGRSIRNVQRTFNSIGVKTVLLPQVIDNDIPYTAGSVASECLDENDVLMQKWADLVKNNTYANSNVASVVKDVVAVVFTGGEDIAPTLYHTPRPWHGIEAEKDFNATRDISDYLLMRYCIDQDIPVLGLCRGAQMLGVVSGATMIQDIPAWLAEKGVKYTNLHRNLRATPTSARDFAPHDVVVTEGSLLAQFTGSTMLHGVPSSHHQSIDSVDESVMEVIGVTDTQGYHVVEAVQRTDCSLALGIQSHPEAAVAKHLDAVANESSYMDYTQAQAIFRHFVERSKQVARAKKP